MPESVAKECEERVYSDIQLIFALVKCLSRIHTDKFQIICIVNN